MSWFGGACTDQPRTIRTSKNIMMVTDSNVFSERICESIVINNQTKNGLVRGEILQE